MLAPQQLYGWLTEAGISFFTGVPDSLLKDFCAFVTERAPADRHLISANEGGAVGLAMGHYLASGTIPLVYMQNSGVGNAINPLTSLADPAIYGIPMILMVGWRGEPGFKDEPQHQQMGRVTLSSIESVGVAYTILSDEPGEAEQQIRKAVADAQTRSAPHALIVRKGTFAPYAMKSEPCAYEMSREQAIAAMMDSLPPDAAVIATTGKPSRELFEIRQNRAQSHDGDLLIVGGMGHASQIALALALEQTERPVYCLDGDGALLMHMGGLALIGSQQPANFKHVVVNNGAHDSVGGQPTVGFKVDFCQVALGCGYRSAVSAQTPAALEKAFRQLAEAPGPALLEARVCKGSRSDLGRPTMSPQELKRSFMGFLRA